MRLFKLTLTTLVICSLAACSHKYKTDSYTPPPAPLSREASAYIMLASDGVYGQRTYAGSGQTLSRETSAAFLRYFTNVSVGSKREDRNSAFANAKAANLRYVIEPTILHWEDRSTEWSGRPDRITIKLVVWDPVLEKAISTSLERASSKWGTFGGDHPQDLLPRLLETAVGRLFQ